MYQELVAVGVCVLLAYLFRKNSRKIKGKVLPGPDGLPLFGCVFEFDESTMPSHLSEYVKKYGDIFQMKMLLGNVVVLNTSELTKKAFCSEEYKPYMNDRAYIFYMDSFRSNSESTAFGNGKIHYVLKKYFHKGLHAYGDGIKHLESKVMTEMENVVSKIDTFSGQEFSLVSVIQRSLTNVISLVVC